MSHYLITKHNYWAHAGLIFLTGFVVGLLVADTTFIIHLAKQV